MYYNLRNFPIRYLSYSHRLPMIRVVDNLRRESMYEIANTICFISNLDTWDINFSIQNSMILCNAESPFKTLNDLNHTSPNEFRLFTIKSNKKCWHLRDSPPSSTTDDRNQLFTTSDAAVW